MRRRERSTKALIALVAITMAASAHATPPPETPAPLTDPQLTAYPDARGMPADVQHFIVRWQDCVHWLGEEPYDSDRRRQIEQAVAASCPGLDHLGAEIRRRHAGSAEILARIADYEEVGQ